MVVALGAGLGLVAGVIWLSHAPWEAHPGGDGVLRLSLSARPERIEECRTLTAEELASRPAHMRQATVCEGTSASYRLRVATGDSTLLETEVTGGGARRDRPLHVLREFPLPPGPRHLSVVLARVDPAPAAPPGDTAAGRSAEVLPASLRLDTTLTLEAHRVVLVTYDPRQQRLLALTAPRAP